MIEFKNVEKMYGNGTLALKGVSFTIEDGEFVFLVGPSGSGKSTIIGLMNAEKRATSGKVIINGFDLTKIKDKQIPFLRRTIGVVFQDFRLIENKTVFENIAFAMRVIGASEDKIKDRVNYVLKLVGMEDMGNRLPEQLSGGEQQRVAIARALVNNPRMIIADEPTGNLDPDRSYELMKLFDRINALGTTVLVVTHEKHLVEVFAKRVISIESGKIVKDGMDGY